MTFDRHRNVVLYERILAATNDLAKRRVEAVAGIKWDEIVTKAIIGQFTPQDDTRDQSTQDDNSKRKYLKESKKEDVEMLEEEEKNP